MKSNKVFYKSALNSLKKRQRTERFSKSRLFFQSVNNLLICYISVVYVGSTVISKQEAVYFDRPAVTERDSVKSWYFTRMGSLCPSSKPTLFLFGQIYDECSKPGWTGSGAEGRGRVASQIGDVLDKVFSGIKFSVNLWGLGKDHVWVKPVGQHWLLVSHKQRWSQKRSQTTGHQMIDYLIVSAAHYRLLVEDKIR